MKKKIIFIIITSILFSIGMTDVYAAAGGNGGQGTGGGNNGGGTSCSYPTDAGKNMHTDTYLFDLVQRKKGSTNFKHLGCIIIGKEANRAKYDKNVHKNCKKITSLGSKGNAESLKNIAKYLSENEGKGVSALNKQIKKNPDYTRGYAKTFDSKYAGSGFDSYFKKNANTDFGGDYGYRILIQKFIYVGCTGNWEKYVVPRKEAYREGTGIKSKVNEINIIGDSWQGDLFTKDKDIGIKIGKDIPPAKKSNFTNKNDGTGYNIIWWNTDDVIGNTCTVTKEDGKKVYYDLCKDANGNLTKDGKKCKTEVKITKNGKDKNGNQLYKVSSLIGKTENYNLTLNQVQNYINNNCKTGPICKVVGNTCYDNAGLKMKTCNEATKSWISKTCKSQCWHDETTDTYYEDTSGQGTSISASKKRTVWNYNCTSSWNGDCAAPYSSAIFSDKLESIPSPGVGCSRTDGKFSTNDCTYAKNVSQTKKCYYTTQNCQTVSDYETKTDKNGKTTKVKVGEHVDCTDDNHYGSSYTYSTTCSYTGQSNEYYIDSQKQWITKNEADQWTNTCKIEKKSCSFDTDGDANDDAWYDDNSNYHPDGLTSKIALWINKKCKATKPSAKVTCSDCNSTNTNGTAFKYTETNVTNGDNANGYSVLGSYFGGDADNETDLISNHYLKYDNGGNQVYCSEELTINLPNGQTTTLNKAQAGRYITINLQSPIENIINMTPITITSTQTCSAIENKEITVRDASKYTSLSSLQTASSRETLKTYVEEKYDTMKNTKRADELGGIKLKYDDKEYKIDLSDDESELEQFLVTNSKDYKDNNNVAVLKQEATYTLKSNVYQYTSIKDGSVSKIKPDSSKLSNYYNLGNSTLPIRFAEGVSNHVTFVYNYEGTGLEKVFEDTDSFPLDSSSQTCVNNIKNENYYTCEINNKGKESSQNVCKIQKTDNGTKYYYNNKELSEKEYQKQCHCFEKDNKYYLNGSEISQDDYNQLCPAQCTTVCPEGEICCPVGGSDMPCSIDGICPTSGGNKLIYRTIDLKNPFTGQDTNKQGRNTGSNWCSYTIKTGTLDCSNLNDGVNSNTKKTSSSEKNKIVLKHIKNNAGAVEDDVYNQTPQYSITLDSQTIDNIRNYNENQQKSGGYDDFTLSCYNASSDQIRTNLRSNGIYTTNVCRSEFLRNNNIFSRSISGVCSNGGYDNLLTCSERSVK